MKFLFMIFLYILNLEASIGKISALNGKIIIDRNEKILDVDIGFNIEEKDIISTNDNSKAQITLNDGTVLTLGKNSKLNINEYLFDEKTPQESKANFKFVEGTFKSITGAIGKVAPERFKLETKSASIGIRGTIVVGSQEKVACTQGQITVTSAGVTQILGAGMMTDTQIGKPPSIPTKIEGNLLKEVDNVGNKEESKSTTSETKEKASEEKTSESNKSDKSSDKEQTTTTQTNSSTEQNNSQPVQQSSNLQTSSLNQNTSSASSNISSFTEVTNTVNTTITQTSTNKVQEDVADAKKKAEAIDAATLLAIQANTIAQSVATASTNANSASTSASSIAQGLEVSTETQTAINTATIASTSANTLSSQAQILKAEIATLLVQAQNASSSEAVTIYEQIKTKTSQLNAKLTEATSAVTTAQNSLKTVSVNLSSSLSNQANTIAQSVATASTNANSASTSASSIAQGLEVSIETQTAINTATIASTSTNTLSSQAQILKAEIATLLVQAQNASSSEAVTIYEQIKTKTSQLNAKLTEATSAVTTAQNSLKTVSVNLSSSLSNQANTIAQSVATASTNANSASTSASSIAQGLEVSTETQTAINTATIASTSANTLSSQAQILKAEIATLLVQAQNASSSEAVTIYEQIKTKTSQLNAKLTEATSAVTTAQNSLKTVSVNLSSSLSNQANTIAQSVATASTNANSASTSASSIAQGLEVSTETQTAINTATIASTSANTLSSQAQILKAEIATLLVQAQNASSSEAVTIYEQIKTKTSQLNAKLTEATSAVTTAQNSLKTVSVNLSSSLSNQANTIAQSVATASTNANSASTSASSIAQGLEVSTETQTAINTATIASTSANTLSSQAQILKAEIATLLVQAQNASSSEAVTIYEQIKTKTSQLNAKLTEATSAVTTAQNSLKTVSVNLSSSLSNQANTIIETITSQVTNTQTSANTVSQLLENASTSALAEVNALSNGITQSEETISSLSMEAQTLKDDIKTLLSQAQNSSASEAATIYGQIKTKSDSLNSLLTQVQTASSNASSIAQNISNAIVNVPVYSTSINISSTGSGSVGSKTFTVGSGGSTVTIATYGSSDGSPSTNTGDSAVGFDPVLILLKLNSSGNYVAVSNGKNDDSWIVADNYYNSILNLSLSEGTYKILVADYKFDSDEALAGINGGTNDSATVKLYFTSTSNLTFDSSIEKYSYITRYNNKAYINDSSYPTAQIEDNNAKFGILADSNVGTAIKIDNYGYFVTISDSFDNSKNTFLNTSEVDDESSWGYWSKTIYTDSSGTKNSIDMKSAWISGNQVTAPTNYNATFQGQVLGGVKNGNNTGSIKLDSDNVFKATINIGTATITNSLIQFKESLSNNLWSGTFNTTGSSNVNSQGFSSSIVNNSNNINGSLSGKYFGTTNADNTTTVKSIGGEFNMINGGATANGVFKAR